MQSYVPLATEKGAAEPTAGCLNASEATPHVLVEDAPGLRTMGVRAGLTLPRPANLFARALFAPLTDRVRRGEGGLLALNLMWAWQLHPLGEACALVAVSLLCLVTLYLFNDVVDARGDLSNPKKDVALATSYVEHQSTYLMVWLGLTTLAITAATWISRDAVLGVCAVSSLNVVYSLACKKIAYIDLLCVCLWGGAFASIATSAPAWILMTGAMTAVCHIYQASEDRDTDTANDIVTSATLATVQLSILQALLTLVMILASWKLAPGVVPLTFTAFIAYWMRWHDQPRTGWFVTKVHFAVVVLLLFAGS